MAPSGGKKLPPIMPIQQKSEEGSNISREDIDIGDQKIDKVNLNTKRRQSFNETIRIVDKVINIPAKTVLVEIAAVNFQHDLLISFKQDR